MQLWSRSRLVNIGEIALTPFTDEKEDAGFLGRKIRAEPEVKTISRGQNQVHLTAEILRGLRDRLG
jgi:hypothetical protein